MFLTQLMYQIDLLNHLFRLFRLFQSYPMFLKLLNHHWPLPLLKFLKNRYYPMCLMPQKDQKYQKNQKFPMFRLPDWS
jgi:hypothetical protein